MSAITMPFIEADCGVRERPALFGVPWDLWCGALAVTASMIGMEWDISWHVSIGRDTFWTPAHLLIQFCGVMTAVVCGWLVWASTFSRSRVLWRDNSVTIFGVRGSLGCFMAAWGGLAMVVSAPFDNWWHSAYGLDVQILSPPHTLLFLGLRLICFGYLLMIAGAMNRAAEQGAANFKALQWLFLYLGGLIVSGHMLLLTQATDNSVLHSSTPYKDMALVLLVMLPLLWQASRHPWAATWAAAIYTVLRILQILIFPLFPATPKLGPVYNQVTHLIPASFPILILVPAVALDLLWQRTGKFRPWLTSMLSGIVFVVTLVAVEWPFSSFLATPASENRFFGTMYYSFSTPEVDRQHRFWFTQTGWTLWHGFLVATVVAMLTTWIGLQVGRWMRGVQR